MQIEQLIKFIKSQETKISLNSRLLDVYSGNLHKYVELSLSKELSSSAFEIARQRIPSINLLQRITNKLSKVYTDIPKRTTSDNSDQDILNVYIENSNLQSALTNAEVLVNLNKYCAIEPYIDSGMFQFRVLAAHEFCVYSDDEQNPNRVTHFIKYMGSQSKDKKTVNVYWVYTDSEFIIVDSDGDVLQNDINPYGVIPFVYINSDNFNLIPEPDIDSFNNSLIVPKLLTDLNYAVQFMSHSILYGIDVDASNLKGNPDSFWSIQSSEGENKKPQLGALSPTVEVDKVLSLIAFTVSEWLSCSGIKPGSVGTLTTDNAASGISKIVDESETSAVVDKNRILLVRAEKQLWKLVSVIHNVLLPTGMLFIQKGLSQDLNVSVMFPIQQPIKDPTEKRNELKFKLENKLTSYARALKEANPDLSEDEIMKLKLEIESELTNKQIETNNNNTGVIINE